MTIPVLNLSIDHHRHTYQPGDTIAGSFRVDAPDGGTPHAYELSVLWSTEGKGDEDMAVFYFHRVTTDDITVEEMRQAHHFSTVLPNSPLSYDGVLLKINWCVRLRAFLPRGKELVTEFPFRLGHVPPAKAVLS